MNRYKKYMNNVPDAPGLEKKVLSEIKEENNFSRTAAPRHSIARFAGIAAALVILISGGIMIAQWLQNNQIDSPVTPLVTNPSASAATSPASVTSDVTAQPSPEYDLSQIETRIIAGYTGISDVLGNDRWASFVFEEADGLRGFIQTYNIREGQANSVDTAPSGLPDDVDFTQNIVLCVLTGDSSSPVYTAPRLFLQGNTLQCWRQTEPYKDKTDDLMLRGYFLIASRDFYETAMGSEMLHLVFCSAEPFDSTDYADITPDALRQVSGIRILKNREDCESYVVWPDGTYTQLGSGFGGYGVVDIRYDEDTTCLIYTYSFGSGFHRSHVGVFSLLDCAEIYISTAYPSYDMCLEKLPDGRWGVYHADVTIGNDFSAITAEKGKILAYLSVEENTFKFDIIAAEVFPRTSEAPDPPPSA